jgi:hypothetical protein
MGNKKDLAKIALTALILASATPVMGHADIETHGIFLAVGCAAHGCPAAKSSTADTQVNNHSNYSPANQSRSGAPNWANAEENQRANYDSKNSSDYGTMRVNQAETNNMDYSYSGKNANVSATLTEAQLLGMLNPQGKAIYQSLDPETKALAIQLASQDSYRDKNLAVKEAQRRMNERRSFNR